MNDKSIGMSKSEPDEDLGKTKQKRAKGSGATLDSQVEDLKDTANATQEQISAQAAKAAGAVREQAEGFVEQGKSAGADRIAGFARAARGAADDLAEQSPQTARYVGEAATEIERLSTSLRERGTGELVGMVDAFARRQPTAFFGAAVFAGFALTRFLKSSSESGGHAKNRAPASSGSEATRSAQTRSADAGSGDGAAGATSSGFVTSGGRLP